jgi:hypothetical protein
VKLSEAIRLGAMLTKQCFGKTGWRGRNGGELRTCALGSAHIAIGEKSGADTGKFFPVSNIPAFCPLGACQHRGTKDVGGVIAHLNDEHRWTRERIADWVATIEAQQEELAAPTIPIHEEESQTV